MPAAHNEILEPTADLLRRYRQHGSEGAFRGLVQRYAGLVYAAALRKTGERAAAQDVMQNVFAALAHRAAALPEDERLGSWLHRRACMAAADYLKAERRRHRREQTAAALTVPGHSLPEALTAALDDALAGLHRADRDILTLRYLEGRSVREVSTALGISEDAAQKRASRAIAKLRARLAGTPGWTSALTAAGITAALESARAGGREEHAISATVRAVWDGRSATTASAWKAWALLAPAGAGVVFTCLASAPAVLHQRSTPPSSASAVVATTDSRRLHPLPGYAPGLSFEETVHRLVALLTSEPEDYAPPHAYYQQVALAASVPAAEQPQALRLMLALLAEQKFALTGNRGRFLYYTWLETVSRTAPEVLLDLMHPPSPSWFLQLAGSHFYTGLRAMPAAARDTLCRHILNDPHVIVDASRAAVNWFGRLDSDGTLDTTHKPERFAECMEGLRLHGSRGWAEAAIPFIESPENYRRFMAAIGQKLTGDALMRVRDAAANEWAKSSWRDLAEWSSSQPPAARNAAIGRVLHFAGSKDLPPEERMAPADFAYPFLSDPRTILAGVDYQILRDPETWLPWLAAHRDIFLNNRDGVLPFLNKVLTGSHLPFPKDKEAYLKTPAGERLLPFLKLWRETDPYTVTDCLQSDATDNYTDLRAALRTLP